MKQFLWLLLFLLPSCSKAKEDSCGAVTNTAVGAALGDSTDAYNLGVEFYTGKCIERDYASAAMMWEKAVAADVISAKNNLGYLLSEGLGVDKNETRAAELWREAALAGHAEAQVHLGVAIFHGNGVPRNQIDGLAWVIRSADSATRYAEIGGGEAVSRMAADERAKLLASAPGLLPAAETRARSLVLTPHER